MEVLSSISSLFLWFLNSLDDVPHSLSFSSSLFSGVFHDLTATVSYLIRKKKVQTLYLIPFQHTGHDASSLRVSRLSFSNSLLETTRIETENLFKPIGDESLFPFFIPPLPPLLQLFGIGEIFHPRSLLFLEISERNRRDKFVSGMLNCSYSKVPEFLLCSDDVDVSLFKAMIQRNIQHSIRVELEK